jgi:hypothetical protein
MSSQTLGRPAVEDSAAGKAILMIVSPICALLVFLGLIYFAGASGRHTAAVNTSGCVVSLYISSLPCITQPMLVSQYDTTVAPAGKLLSADMAAYVANERHNLEAAEAALTAEAATEQSLNNNLNLVTFTAANRATTLAEITNAASNGGTIPLTAVTFTPQMTVIVNTLMRDDTASAALADEQAKSASFTKMRTFDRRSEAALDAVQAEMKALLQAVDARS